MRSGGTQPTMSDPHASDTPMTGSPHGLGDHGDAHGHGDELLGPVDWPAWLAGLVGAALGLAVAWCFMLATAG